ncbi:GumC family protein [Sphingobacterium griseoflavum]|nr:polysaccharide biosynthesis tyrosine autokinase [Sphingobacterium griseoflavum]
MNAKNEWDSEIVLEKKVINNKELLKGLNKAILNWYWFLLSSIVCIALAFFYLRYTVPQYKVHAKLLVSDDKKGGGMMSSTALVELSGLMGATSSVDNEVEILKTADLMREMVLTEKAFITFYIKGAVHDIPTYKTPYNIELISSPDSVIETRRFSISEKAAGLLELTDTDTLFKVKAGEPFYIHNVGNVQISKILDNEEQLPASYSFSITPIADVIDSYTGALNVEITNKNVSTIDLTFVSSIQKQGEQYLRTFIDKYVERNLHDKNVIADSTLSFINSRLKRITNELAGVEDKISGYKQSTKLSDISEQSRILLETSASNTKSLAEVEVQLAAIESMAAYLKDDKNPRVVPSSIIPQDVAFNSLISRYNELVLQRERLLLANTENNPLVENINLQISGVRTDMVTNLESTKRNLQLLKANQLNTSNNITNQIQQVPSIERGYIDLARLQQIKQAQYIFLQEKWEETAISRTANVSNSKVIDTPKSEKYPFSPKRKLIYFMALFIGVLIPAAVLYVKEMFSFRISDIEELKNISNVPILGFISHSNEDGHVVINKSSRSPIAEQFRALRTNLEFSLNGGKKILFTSSMSGEGKSYVALNLAVSLALLQKKVLLMELDLRKPSITSKLGLPAGKGFSHYIVRPDMILEEIIMPSQAHEDVDLIQAGAIPPNPAELLLSERTNELMKILEDKYDFILIDAPPVGMVTDAQILSRYSDTCLYIIRQNYTFKEQLSIPKDLVQSGKIGNIQFIVNDVKAPGGFYSNYGYGYGYGYGNYGDINNKKKFLPFFKR